MVRALDARDAYTAGHSATVAVYSRDIAREMGMDDREVDLVHLTGLVHDIGKIGVRAEVLEKTSALHGGVVESPDIRAGMAMLLAALAAQGDSVIHNIGQIERGYERIDERLRALGAQIERIDGGGKGTFATPAA